MKDTFYHFFDLQNSVIGLLNELHPDGIIESGHLRHLQLFFAIEYNGEKWIAFAEQDSDEL